MTSQCPLDLGCSAWKFKIFGDCVCTTRDSISFNLGLVSIICWAVAEIPQIIANWRAGNSEGVSLAFILTWTVGDIFNLVGCQLDRATLPTQFYTAVLYTATTLVLVGQHIWYNSRKREAVQELHFADEKEKLHARDPLEGLFPSDPTLADGTRIPGVAHWREDTRHHAIPMASPSPRSPVMYTGSWRRLTLSTSYGVSPRLNAFFLVAMITGGLKFGSPLLLGTNQLPSGRSVGTPLVDGGRKLLQAGEFRLFQPAPANSTLASPLTLLHLLADGDAPESDPDSGLSKLRDAIGQILGWAMTCIYLTGRIPQIFLNITRGSVEGLSFSMFAFAIGGNATYFASILVRSLQWSLIQPNLPWLVDSACCLAMDFFILGQFIYYHSASRKQLTGYSVLSDYEY